MHIFLKEGTAMRDLSIANDSFIYEITRYYASGSPSWCG